MTSSNQPKSIPAFVLLVYGKPTSADLPQASWFHAEDRTTVIAAAQSLKFSVLDIQTDAEKALIVGVHEGVLKGNSRMIVGSVTPEVFKRIEEYVSQTSPERAAASVEASGAKTSIEQRTNIREDGNATSSPAKAQSMPPEKLTPIPETWAALRVGSHVAAKYWYSNGQANGWWIAVITAIEGNDFIIRWPDEPRTPPLKIERKHVAILHPDFDVTREWDRKP